MNQVSPYRNSSQEVATLSVLHEQVIDFVIANPGATRQTIAQHFGYSASWINQLMGNDLFRSRLFERQAQLSGLNVVQTQGRMQELAELALTRLKALMASTDADDTRKIAELALKATGAPGFQPGPRGPAPTVNVAGNATFVSVPLEELTRARQRMLGKQTELLDVTPQSTEG